MWYETMELDVEFENLDKEGGVPAGFSCIVYDQDDPIKQEMASLIGRVWIEVGEAEKIHYETKDR